MINFDGQFIGNSEKIIEANNRAVKFGDALFETLKVADSKIIFLEDHYFRLMASMRMLRMEIPMYFTLEYFQQEIEKTFEKNKLSTARIRVTIFRKNGGLYSPMTNEISYFIEAGVLNSSYKENYSIDLFKDYYIYSGLLSSIKTTNKMVNVLAAIFAQENELDNCILLNERKFIAEVINGNVFMVIGNEIKTPPISEGCIKGIVRKKIIDLVNKTDDYKFIETPISPFELQKADEVFISNSIVGIQPVNFYKKNKYQTTVALTLRKELEKLV